MATTSRIRRDVSPMALASLATGGYLVLAALILMSPFVLSPYAIQNDVYMSNLFIGPPLLVLGGVLFLASPLVARFRSREMAWGPGLVLAVVSGGLLALLYPLIGGHYVSVGPPPNWPPYLTGPTMIAISVLGLAVFGGAWEWGSLMGRQPRRRRVDDTLMGS